MNGLVETEVRHWALCPSCQGRLGTIDHLAGQMKRVGPWHCDTCGEAWRLETNGRAVEKIEPAGGPRFVKATVMLVLPPQKAPVTLILNTHAHEPIEDGAEYFYNEHTCPVNWMQHVVEIRIGDDSDPHGLFEFRSIAPGHVPEPS